MNAYDLSTELLMASSEMEYNHIVDDWKLLSDSANMLRQQADIISVLEANYKIQVNIVEKSLNCITELERLNANADSVIGFLRGEREKLQQKNKELEANLKAQVDLAHRQADRIAELEKVLEHEGIGIGRDLLNGGIAIFRKAKNDSL